MKCWVGAGDAAVHVCVDEENNVTPLDDDADSVCKDRGEGKYASVERLSSLRSWNAPFWALAHGGPLGLVLRFGGVRLGGVVAHLLEVAAFRSASRLSCTRSGLLGRSAPVERN